MVKEMVNPEARREDAKFLFYFVFEAGSGHTIVRSVGKIFSCGDGRHLDDVKSLEELGFQIGYRLDVAIP
ncbi:hypothetical protein MLD38_018312 [Melastoma candidum]|uniref:Uncharacterized protein n=1 Tax=Melastoma candidum TaxID=119954 RepID=A0ACB9QWY2_9MYRT|nr:hypothetical protein MLD38_018312 [Melastoma candidum]